MTAPRIASRLLFAAGAVLLLTVTGCAAWRIGQVTVQARAHSDRVVLMPAGNVGNAPFFFAPASWWMTQRSRSLHAYVKDTAERTGATYVNLFHERDEDPFVINPALNARDGLHPSDAGYELWWQQLRPKLAPG